MAKSDWRRASITMPPAMMARILKARAKIGTMTFTETIRRLIEIALDHVENKELPK